MAIKGLKFSTPLLSLKQADQYFNTGFARSVLQDNFSTPVLPVVKKEVLSQHQLCPVF